MLNQFVITGLDRVLVGNQELFQRTTISLSGLVTAKPLFLIYFQVNRDGCSGSLSYASQDLGVSNSVETLSRGCLSQNDPGHPPKTPKNLWI